MFGEITLSGNEKMKKVKWALLTMVRHPWEHGNAAQMIAYSIYRGVTWGFLDKKYIPDADRMREAANDKVDDMGFVQGVAAVPYFDLYGISPEGQAFYIMMEAAAQDYEKLRKG